MSQFSQKLFRAGLGEKLEIIVGYSLGDRVNDLQFRKRWAIRHEDG
jgi:hypothetical protein